MFRFTAPDHASTPDGSGTVTRRTVLRRSALAGGAAVVGLGGFASTAAATECPRSPGYWANHPWPDTNYVEGIVAPNDFLGVTMTVEEWQVYLLSPTRGDKAHIMAKQLIATLLNYQYRPKEDPECVYGTVHVEGLGTTEFNEVKVAAMHWLRNSNFGTGQPQRSWIVDADEYGELDGEPLKDALDAFNNGTLGLECDCDDGNDDEGRGRGRGTGRGRRRGRGNDHGGNDGGP